MYCRREQVELNREQLSMGWERIDTTKELQVPKNTWSVRHWQLILEMEKTGGQPDVIGFDSKLGEFIFADCSAESPKGRINVCYDKAGLYSRKENKPLNNAIDMASAMGIEILNENQYRSLQKLGNFDLKTSS